MHAARRLRIAGLMATLAIAVFGTAAPAVDQVIFKDGFSITGRRFREQEMITDANNGTSVTVPKARGFDIIETGPKWIIFSNKTQQVGKLLENVRGEKDFAEYKIDFGYKGKSPLPAGGLVKVGEFNEKWIRTIRVDMPATKSFAEIEQRIFSMGPRRIIMPSSNYMWYPFYDPREFDPIYVRKLLAWHPELKESPGEPDATKRLHIAQFMKDAGWLDQAEKEIADARTAVTKEWPKELSERAEKLTAEIQKTRTTILVTDLEKSLRAGKYQTALAAVKQFDEKHADAVDAKLFATLKAQVEIVQPRYDKVRKLLRNTLDRLSGGSSLSAALVGGSALAQTASLTPQRAVLLAAGEAVYAELHPDTTDRVDFFLSLADQAERKRSANEDPGVPDENLVALAVSGWVKGKNGAEQNAEAAARYWKWRTMLLKYQVEPIINNRRTLYQSLVASDGPLTPEEIAQIIVYLPPPEPESLESRPAAPVIEGLTPGTGIYRRNTGPVTEIAKGIDYMVRLPSEYHHGRPSRLIVALSNNNLPAEAMVNQLAADADRNGYIIVAPVWVNEYEGAYAYKGDQHFKARAVLRDALKHYRIDNDRVFLFGYGEGANFAMDLGASHPDLFAGVVAMGPNPKHFNMFMHYWRNCQKLPVYCCIGSIAADSFSNLRRVFEDWMPKGYPALGVVYRGRGMEWFGPEVPIMFDWMDPKKRVNGTAVLRVNEPVEPWMSMRNADNRFYWVGSEQLDPQFTLEARGNKSFLPAEISADIKQGNQIVLKTRGTKNVVLWFDRTIIDWSKPISVTINGTTPSGYKAKVLTPDIELMLEQLYANGDRSLLFLNRLEFPTVR